MLGILKIHLEMAAVSFMSDYCFVSILSEDLRNVNEFVHTKVFPDCSERIAPRAARRKGAGVARDQTGG